MIRTPKAPSETLGVTITPAAESRLGNNMAQDRNLRSSSGGEFVYGHLAVGVPWAEDSRRKALLVRTVGEMLGLQAERPEAPKDFSTRPFCSIQKITCIQLNTRLGRADSH